MEIYISEANWNKIMGFAKEAYDEHKCEIGGMAVCKEDKDGDWVIENPVILKQEISSTNCVLDKDELAKYYTKTGMSKRYKNANYRFLWWHSHHTMAAFWSNTDLTAIEEFNEGDFSFALVINLKGEYKMRVSVWDPIEVHNDVELNILRKETSVSKSIKDQVEELCETPTYKSTGWTYGGYQTNTQQLSLIGEADKETKPELDFQDSFEQVHTNLEADLEALQLRTITLKKFREKYNDVNGKLAKAKIGFRIDLTPIAKISDVLTIWPMELIQVDQERQGDVDDLMELWGYNLGYFGQVGRRYYGAE